jgi:hypothetical protein
MNFDALSLSVCPASVFLNFRNNSRQTSVFIPAGLIPVPDGKAKQVREKLSQFVCKPELWAEPRKPLA